MKDFENKDFRTAKNPTRLHKRYVDDTFVIQDIELKGQISKAHQFHS